MLQNSIPFVSLRMTSHQASELDSYATDSVASSPRGRGDDQITRVRFMCSFGGKILPRPHDNRLRYVGGDTRIVAVHRSTNFSTLLTKLYKLSGTIDVTVKYQLPNEDLDSLISVTTDEDVENMMEEYDRLTLNQNPRSDRLRLFLFPKGDDSRASSISSANRDHWFLDALNSSVGGGGSALERGRSETSSIISELPDYLFGLDNSDETQPRDPKIRSTRQVLSENVSNSVPGSPATDVASPFCSTSSAPSVQSILNLPPVKTKPDNPDPVVEHKENQVEGFVETGEPSILQPTGYPGNPMIHYISDPRYPSHTVQQVPTVYYIPGPVQPGNVPVQPVHMQAPYVHQYPAGPGQIPLGYHHLGPGVGQVYNGGMRSVTATTFDPYDVSGRVVPDGMNQQAFYGVKNSGIVSMYSGMVVPGGEDLQGIGLEVKPGQASQ